MSIEIRPGIKVMHVQTRRIAEVLKVYPILRVATISYGTGDDMRVEFVDIIVYIGNANIGDVV